MPLCGVSTPLHISLWKRKGAFKNSPAGDQRQKGPLITKRPVGRSSPAASEQSRRKEELGERLSGGGGRMGRGGGVFGAASSGPLLQQVISGLGGEAEGQHLHLNGVLEPGLFLLGWWPWWWLPSPPGGGKGGWAARSGRPSEAGEERRASGTFIGPRTEMGTLRCANGSCERGPVGGSVGMWVAHPCLCQEPCGLSAAGRASEEEQRGLALAVLCRAPFLLPLLSF